MTTLIADPAVAERSSRSAARGAGTARTKFGMEFTSSCQSECRHQFLVGRLTAVFPRSFILRLAVVYPGLNLSDRTDDGSRLRCPDVAVFLAARRRGFERTFAARDFW